MWEFPRTYSHFFTADQKAQVAALFEAILPGSETQPGATDADAAEYVDRLLTMDREILYDIPNLRQLYPVALLATEDAARRKYGRGIAQLTLDERTELLTQLQRGALEGTSFPQADQRRFFTELRTRCIEGCFGDSRWGGNKDNVMWRWYGWTMAPEEFQRPRPASEAVAAPPSTPKLPIREPKRAKKAPKGKPAARRPRT